MDYKEVTEEDVVRFQEEIKHFYNLRRLFIGIGWSCIVTAFFFTPGFASEQYIGICGFFFATLFIAGIVFFVLKSAMFNRRIRNRKILIRDAAEYQKMKKVFEQNRADN